MPTYPARKLRRIDGFTLLELLIVLVTLAVLLPFVFLSFDVLQARGKERLFSVLSLEVSLLREKAATDYVIKCLEFDIGSGVIKSGNFSPDMQCVAEKEITIPEDLFLRDVVVNGQKFTQGRCVAKVYPFSFSDKFILHFETSNGNFYTIISHPLIAKLEEFDEYVEETKAGKRTHST